MDLVLMAVAGLVVGALANWPVERLPREILEEEKKAAAAEGEPPPAEPGWAYGRWRTVRRILLSVATACLFALAATRYDGDWLRVAATAIFAAAFLALAVTDLEHQLLPDKIVLPGIAVAIAISPFLAHLNPWDGVLGAAAGFLIFMPVWLWAQLTGRAGRIMGFGDIKLAAMMGAALGLQFMGIAMYVGVLLGGAAALLLIVGRAMAPGRLGRLRLMPYGTFLAIGALCALYYGRPIADWVIDVLA